MKLHILSDLHTEFADFSPPDTNADIVILAGDIGVGLGGIEWAARRFPRAPVIYVPGNHEFYDQDIGLTSTCTVLRRPGFLGGYPGENRRSEFRDDLVVSVS